MRDGSIQPIPPGIPQFSIRPTPNHLFSRVENLSLWNYPSKRDRSQIPLALPMLQRRQWMDKTQHLAKVGLWRKTGIPEHSSIGDGSHLFPLDQLKGSQELPDIPAGFEDGIPGEPGRALQAGLADAASHEFIRALEKESRDLGSFFPSLFPEKSIPTYPSLSRKMGARDDPVMGSGQEN